MAPNLYSLGPTHPIWCPFLGRVQHRSGDRPAGPDDRLPTSTRMRNALFSHIRECNKMSNHRMQSRKSRYHSPWRGPAAFDAEEELALCLVGESVVAAAPIMSPGGDVRMQVASIVAMSRVEKFLARGQSLAKPPIFASSSFPFPAVPARFFRSSLPTAPSRPRLVREPESSSLLSKRSRARPRRRG
jgi:hypothetical protein